jgi:predicted CoA-binding protein
MTSKKMVDDFFAEKKLALVRISPEGPKFGNIYTELTERDYKVFRVCPNFKKSRNGDYWENLAELPEKVGGVIITTPIKTTIDVIKQAAEAKIPRVWMQLGSESKEAVQLCNENNITAIHGECIMMFAEPVKSIHKFHRWIWKILGKLPN